MISALVGFYSRSGNTKEMAHFISESLKDEDLNITTASIEEIKAKDLLEFDVVLIGSPTYYGTMASEIKQFLDESVSLHGQLEGKIGGAFSSSANIGGGNETTILSILNAFLIHGMVVIGNASGDHYGPVSIGRPDARVKSQCVRYAKIIAELAHKIYKDRK